MNNIRGVFMGKYVGKEPKTKVKINGKSANLIENLSLKGT
jgi:hypothetical protein